MAQDRPDRSRVKALPEVVQADLEVFYRLVAARTVLEVATLGDWDWSPELLRQLGRLLWWAELHARRAEEFREAAA